jgi:hypothetical protein
MKIITECQIASDIPNLKEENMVLLGNGGYSVNNYIYI